MEQIHGIEKRLNIEQKNSYELQDEIRALKLQLQNHEELLVKSKWAISNLQEKKNKMKKILLTKEEKRMAEKWAKFQRKIFSDKRKYYSDREQMYGEY